MPRALFDTTVLHRAIESERMRRGVSLRELALATRVSATTIRRASLGGPMEADGVFCLLRWLNQPAEAFLANAPEPEPTIPLAPSPLIPRVDTKRLHAALDQRRMAEGFSWSEVASAIAMPHVVATTLRQLAQGGRTEINRYMAICDWLGAPASDFVREVPY